MMIAVTALREKIRKKIFIAVTVISALLTLLLSTGSTTLTIGGEPLTGYNIMMPVVMTVMHAVSCIMAMVMSLGTIPAEYERRTHHLILTRGVSQARYHGELTLANVGASLISHGIFMAGAAVYMVSQGHGRELPMMLPAYLISGLGAAVVSTLSTALSAVMGRLPAGLIAGTVTLAGIFAPLLELAKSMAGGLAGKLLGVMLFLLPDLNSMQSAAAKLLTGKGSGLHPVFTGMFYIYLFAMFVMIYKRKADKE